MNKLSWQWTRQLTKRERLMLQILALVSIVTLTGVYLYLPMLEDRNSLDSEIVRLAQSNSQLMAQARQEANMDAELATISGKLERLNAHLPQKKEIPQFIVLIEQAAATSKVQVRSLSLGDPVDQKTYAEISADMIATGDYIGLVRFIQQMEALPRSARVSAWSITSGKQQLELAVTLSIFVEPQALQDEQGDTLPPGYPVGKASPF